MTSQLGPIGFFSSTPSAQAGVLLAELIGDFEGSVLALPTGAAYEGPDLAVAQIESLLGPLGVLIEPVMVLKRTDAERADLAELVRSARCICLSGASPLHMRSVLKDSTVFAALRAAWHEGAVVIGFDAGAVVLCDPMVDPRGGAFTVGLGLVRDVSVVTATTGGHSASLERTVALAPNECAVVAVGIDGGIVRDQSGVWLCEGDVTIYSAGVEVELSELAGKPMSENSAG